MLLRLRSILSNRSRDGIGRAWIYRRQLMLRRYAQGWHCVVVREVIGSRCIPRSQRHPARRPSAIISTTPCCNTYKGSYQCWRSMRLYGSRIVKDSRDHRKAAECANQRPKSSKHISNILSLLFPIPEPSRHRHRKLSKWRWRDNTIQIPIKVEVPFPTAVQESHHAHRRKAPPQPRQKPMRRNGQRERDASHSNQTFKKLESNHVKQDSGTGPPI